MAYSGSLASGRAAGASLMGAEPAAACASAICAARKLRAGHGLQWTPKSTTARSLSVLTTVYCVICHYS